MRDSMRRIRLIIAAVFAVSLLGLTLSKPGASPAPQQPPNVIACRVMEAHTSPELRLSAAIFHQQDKKEGPRLSSLLGGQSGAAVEFQTKDGARHRARVFRLKSCFGRGLLLFPAGEAQLKERETFSLQFPTHE